MRRRFRRSWYDRILIVGAGRAGVAAAEELRRSGYEGQVALLGEESEGPYDRPSCSKGLLTGHQRPHDVQLPVRTRTDLTFYLGRRAVGIDPDAREVIAHTGESFAYDGLVVATGGGAASPADWANDDPDVHVLHTLSDAWALRRALRTAERVIVVGGGITGCEVASAVRSLARECVLVDSHAQVMTRALGEVVGGYVAETIADEGIDLRLGRRVRSLARVRRGWVIELDNGDLVFGDLVVSTTGAKPDTSWLEGAGADISDGVVCDDSLRVPGMDNTVAAGMVARWPNLRYGYQPRRSEHWISALQQGRGAAQTLLADEGEASPVTVVPRFWTDQFGLRIQVCGELPVDGEVSISEMRRGRRDTARAGVVVGYYRDDRLTGLVAVNAPHAFTSIARSMLATPVPPLENPAPLRRPEPIPATPRRHLAAVG
jgi:NADPH-dependent 2,4-dienoyl-CoA reductase/sulfur reductase-like enzyme